MLAPCPIQASPGCLRSLVRRGGGTGTTLCTILKLGAKSGSLGPLGPCLYAPCPILRFAALRRTLGWDTSNASLARSTGAPRPALGTWDTTNSPQRCHPERSILRRAQPAPHPETGSCIRAWLQPCQYEAERSGVLTPERERRSTAPAQPRQLR